MLPHADQSAWRFHLLALLDNPPLSPIHRHDCQIIPPPFVPCELGTAFLRWRWEPQATLEAVAIGECRRTVYRRHS